MTKQTMINYIVDNIHKKPYIEVYTDNLQEWLKKQTYDYILNLFEMV